VDTNTGAGFFSREERRLTFPRWEVVRGDVSAGNRHVEPIAQPTLAVFECRRTIEQGAVSDFEAMPFEKAGVFGKSRVIPGIRKRLGEIEVFPGAP